MRYVVVLGLILGCTKAPPPPSAPKPDDRKVMLKVWGEQVILPGFRAASSASGELKQALEAVCTHRDAAHLETARAAWATGKSKYSRMSVFSFGPAVEQPLRLGPKINFYPSRPESVDRVLAGEAPIQLRSAATRGFPAIEYVLWSDKPLDDRRCAFLKAAGADLAKQSELLFKAWDPAGGDHLGALTTPRDPWPTVDDALGQVVSRMAHVIETLRDERIGLALGTATGTPRPELAEAPFSGRTLDGARETLKMVELLYRGPTPAAGLSARLGPRKAEIDDAFDAALKASLARLDDIKQPIPQAVVSQPARVRAALDAMGTLQRVIQVDVVAALGLSLRFNDVDGD